MQRRPEGLIHEIDAWAGDGDVMTSRSALCHIHYDDLSGCIKTMMM